MWRIFEVGVDGTGLRQITPETRGVTIPDDPKRPRQNEATFGRFSDFAPAFLPNGRIVFASSRYPGVSGSCGHRTVTLYVINPDGSDLRRIISTRLGALNPWVMQDGRILFSYTTESKVWSDERHRLLADFDFGLYVCDGDFQNLKLVYNDPATDELDPVAVWRRSPKVIPERGRTAPPEDPTAPMTGSRSSRTPTFTPTWTAGSLTCNRLCRARWWRRRSMTTRQPASPPRSSR